MKEEIHLKCFQWLKRSRIVQIAGNICQARICFVKAQRMQVCAAGGIDNCLLPVEAINPVPGVQQFMYQPCTGKTGSTGDE